ncbi:MAG: Uma2 family endonuclease, partial [Bacteroidota bacterium]
EANIVTDIQALDLNKSYTYADYLLWQFKERVELIRGCIFKMPPAPSMGHQEISTNLMGEIYQYLKRKTCKVFHAPFDVRLPLSESQMTDQKVDTVVQPDICVVCDPQKLESRGCIGAPDWIIEILSKSTSNKDLNEKYDLYQNTGVKEYWIVHPAEGTVMTHTLQEDGKYKRADKIYTHQDSISPTIFPDLEIELKWVFR